LSAQIVALVRDVGALATAARCAGVPVRVAREWFARGLGQDPDRPCTPLFAAFAHGVEKSRGEFVARRIRRIEQAAEEGTWTADAWASNVSIRTPGAGRIDSTSRARLRSSRCARSSLP
jgi:hypothetical protein